jgi:protein TonB
LNYKSNHLKINIMNILGNNASKLNRVIFENRNQAYGAFEIRESYTDSLKKSILCLTGVVTVLFGSVFVYNKVNALPSVENVIVLNDPNLEPLEYVTEVNNTPVEARQEAAAVAPAGALTTPRIVDVEPATTTTVNLSATLSGAGSSTATGTAPIGTETSTATSTNTFVASTPAIIPEVIFAEEMPEFEGGNAGVMQYLANSVVYPQLAKEAGVQGIVYVSFVVSEVGKVESAKVLKGIGLGCDEEVLRVVNKMPTWKKPGKNGGHAVKVRFNVPVSFKLR